MEVELEGVVWSTMMRGLWMMWSWLLGLEQELGQELDLTQYTSVILEEVEVVEVVVVVVVVVDLVREER